MPLELPGRSFGYLPDRRNLSCTYCGRSFRLFGVTEDVVRPKRARSKRAKSVSENKRIIIKCPYCGHENVVLQVEDIF